MDLSPRILYCDAHCAIVNKLCGEAVEGSGKGMTDLPLLLSDWLSVNAVTSQEEKTLDLPAAVNRLDVPVTGCALFARTQSALVFLNAAFRDSQDNSVEKHYWAIIEKPEAEISPAATLRHWIAFDTKRNKSYAFDEPGQGRKKAILEYKVIGAGQNYLFLEIQLLTGRHHQIRCQFEKIGLHIKGDLKYGARRSEKNGGIRLHARSISFPNPSGSINSSEHKSDYIHVCSIPPVFDNLWQAFSAFSAC